MTGFVITDLPKRHWKHIAEKYAQESESANILLARDPHDQEYRDYAAMCKAIQEFAESKSGHLAIKTNIEPDEPCALGNDPGANT